MADGPELFVVCKNCGSEVSPYVTECPYCGHRLRKRAPKIRKGKLSKLFSRVARPSLSRLRHDEIPGIRAELGRPYATITIVAVSVIVSLIGRLGVFELDRLIINGPLEGEYWRVVTTLFVYTQAGYEIVTLTAIALFGWLLERRHGLLVPIFVFFIGGVGGTLLVVALDPSALAVGGNGAALALLATWAVRDLRARRAGIQDDADMLGVAVIATILILLPIVVTEANALAGFASGIIGLLLGSIFARLPEH